MYCKLFIFLALALAAVPCSCAAQDSVVLVIVDGLGAAYVCPDMVPRYADGSPLRQAGVDVFGGANASCRLLVRVPETEYGHAVIATGYSNASDETLSYYDATIFDTLRSRGYLCIAVLEKGDSGMMIAEQDAVAHDPKNTIFAPEITVSVNGSLVPPGLISVLGDAPPARQEPGAGVDAYLKYNEWALKKACQVVRYMEEACPEQRYLLLVNAGGVDSAGHSTGYEGYRRTIEGLAPCLGSLKDACASAGTTLVVTADHGMSFEAPGSRGSHASEPAASRDESRIVPMAILWPPGLGCAGTYGQECLAPTLLSLAGCPDTLSMGDGHPLPYGDRFCLYVISDQPSNVSVSGPDIYRQASVHGTWRLENLKAGTYTVSDGHSMIKVGLAHDETVWLAEVKREGGVIPLALYVAAALVSLAGIAVALYLVRRR
jgi:hypothetical protein